MKPVATYKISVALCISCIYCAGPQNVVKVMSFKGEHFNVIFFKGTPAILERFLLLKPQF